MAARAYRVSRFVSVEMPAGTIAVNALFVNILITHPHDTKCRRNASLETAGHLHVERRRRGMRARAYRALSCFSAEMPAGTVPVNVLSSKLLFTQPPDASARETQA
jgi:hypothetical protein